MPRLELYLLGPPRVELDGEPVQIGRRKAIALLAYLAVTGQPHSRDSLAALLWPEYDQSSARADLRRSLSLLNRTLGEEWLTVDRETGSLNPNAEFQLDVQAFRSRLAACEGHGHPPTEVCAECVPYLEAALELYRDDFLAGFTLRDSLVFDEWQFFQTEGLRDEMAASLQRLVHWYSRQDEYEPAIAYARRWLALDPLHEPVHRRLMTLYAQAAALRQYQLCEEALAEELGLFPSEETRTLFERIRAGEEVEPERVAPLPPHNLLLQPTPFVGREAELAELDRLVADPNVRLITILGPGGVGKTRLALAAAEEQLQATATTDTEAKPRFPNGVFFVPLAALSSADQIVPTAAKALGFSFYERREPRQQLLDYLREKRVLLILGGFDPLLSDTQVANAVELLTDLLHTAPRLEILVTSRERLHLRQEQVYSIEGLAFPDWDTPDATAYAAVELFVQSARRVQSDFDLATDDLPHLVRVCRLVEGMPLGIELAGVWVNMLSLADIADETQRSLDFLETGWRDVPARHRSIRVVFETSWHRLGEAERDAFRRLSVFRGAFTRPAAQDVAGASLRVLVSLADKSLLQFDRANDRYQIHELLRQYGAEVLRADPELEATVLDRHSAHYCGWLGQREAELKGARQQTALAEIEADIGNVQVAWSCAVAQRKLAYIDQAVNGLCGYFELRRRYQDGETVSAMAAAVLQKLPPEELAATENQLPLAKALAWQGRFAEVLWRVEAASQLRQQSLAHLEGPALADQDTRAIKALAVRPIIWQAYQQLKPECRRRCEQSLALCKALGDHSGVAEALFGLGAVATSTGSFDEAKQLWEECLALYRELGNQWRVAAVLNGLGWVARGSGAYDQARNLWEESLAFARAQSNLWGIGESLDGLWSLTLFQGQFEVAVDWLQKGVALSRETGDRFGRASAVGLLGLAYSFCGQFAQAHAALEEAAAICQDLRHSSLLGLVTIYRAQSHVQMGRNKEARAQAEMALTLGAYSNLADTPDPRALRTLGWTALAEEQFAEAQQWLEDSVAAFRTVRELHSQEFLAWSLAALGRAAYGLGKRGEAKGHLLEALEIAVEIGAFLPLLHLMPIIPVVLADEEDPNLKERAVELYALAAGHPFVANSRLFEDIAGRYVRAATAGLPPDVVSAAHARGQALDWWEAAAELLTELRQLGWAG